MEGRLLIRRAALFTGGGTGLSDLVIEGERIAAVLPAGQAPTLPGDWEVPADGRAVVPGFIDAHTHLFRVLARDFPESVGPGPRFAERLARVRLPFERALHPPDIAAATRLALAQAALSGVTCVFDHLRCPSDWSGGLEAVASSARELGVRVVASAAAADHEGEPGTKALDAAVALAGRPASPWLRAQIGLEASWAASDALLSSAAEAMKKTGTGLHVHLGEDALDGTRSTASFGLLPLERLDRAGLLTDRTVLAHAFDLERAERERLKSRGCLVAASARSGGATTSTLGVRAAPATDGFAADVRHDALLMGGLRDEPSRALAEALFGERFSLVQGGAADLVILDWRPLDLAVPADAARQQLLTARVAWTVVAGRVVVREGVLLSGHEAGLVEAARTSAQRLKAEVFGTHAARSAP